MEGQKKQLPQKQAFISFARGFSIFSIMLYHYFGVAQLPGFLAKVNKLGGAGIYFFLFASGYGLFFSNGNLKTFYRKRFIKVLLPYYIGITLIFGINEFVQVYHEGWPEYLSHLLLYKMFSASYIYSFGYHFWFISTIVQFYLLWPLLVWLMKRKPAFAVFGAALVVSVVYSSIITAQGLAENGVWKRLVLQYLWVLVLGIAVAKNNLLERLTSYKLPVYLFSFVASLGLAAAIEMYAGNMGDLLNDFFMFTGFTSLCIILYRLSDTFTFLRHFVLWVESFSYPLYLIHIFVLLLYFKFLSITSLHFFEVPVVVAITFVCALLLNKLINSIIPLFDKQKKAHGQQTITMTKQPVLETNTNN